MRGSARCSVRYQAGKTAGAGTRGRASRLEMLRELQPLRLVVRADAGAIQLVRSREHFLVDEAADDLPVLEDERHLARAHLEDSAAALPAGARIAEAGIEEARVMHEKFPDQRV